MNWKAGDRFVIPEGEGMPETKGMFMFDKDGFVSYMNDDCEVFCISWFYDNATRIKGTTFDDLRALEDNWDTYGAPVIDEVSIRRAEEFLHAVNIVPTNTGGVNLEWAIEGIELEIEFPPEQELTISSEIQVKDDNLLRRLRELGAKVNRSRSDYR